MSRISDVIFLNSPFLVRAIWGTKEEFTLSSHIHFDIITPGKLSSIIGKNDREELEEIFVSLVKSVLDIIEVFGNLKGSFIIEKPIEDKVTEREIEGQ